MLCLTPSKFRLIFGILRFIFSCVILELAWPVTFWVGASCSSRKCPILINIISWPSALRALRVRLQCNLMGPRGGGRGQSDGQLSDRWAGAGAGNVVCYCTRGHTRCRFRCRMLAIISCLIANAAAAAAAALEANAINTYAFAYAITRSLSFSLSLPSLSLCLLITFQIYAQRPLALKMLSVQACPKI